MKSPFEMEIEKAGSIPVAEAAAFFVNLKKFPGSPAAMSKTAGWQDPPDETGELEGTFAAPVEQVVAAMGEAATSALRLMNAATIYNRSMRGPLSSSVKSALCSFEWSVKDQFEEMVSRMSALAGAPHIGDPESPPASTNPVEIAKRLIRACQEQIALYRQLCELCGDNSFGHRVEHWMMSLQGLIDDMWKALDPSNDAAPAPSALAAVEEEPADPYAVPGEDELMEEEEPVEEEDVPVDEVPVDEEELAGPEKTAASVSSMLRDGTEKAKGVKRFGQLLTGSRKKALSNKAGGLLQDASSQKGMAKKLREAEGMGSERATNLYVDAGKMEDLAKATKREASRESGAVTTARVGTGLGAGYLGTAALSHKLDKGGKGKKKTAAAMPATEEEMQAAIGDQALKGRLAAVQGAARAEAMNRHQRGERVGDTLGRVGGTLAGATLGKKYIGGPVGTVGGGALGYLTGGKLGKEVGKEVDIVREKQASISAMAERMATRVKLAMGEGEEAEAPMASPTGDTQMQPANYLLAEQMGQQAQHAQELQFFKSKAQQAMQQAMQVMQQTQQQSAQVQQQMMELQQRADSADQAVRSALSEATQARDEALAQTQQAANMRMGMQKLRQQMVEIASQDPAAVAAAEMDQVAQQSKDQVAMEAQAQAEAEAADAMMMGQPGAAGPAGQAPDAAAAPQTPPAPGGPGGEPGPAGMQGTKAASVKVASLMGAGAGALVGGGLGLKRAVDLATADPGSLRDRVQVLEQTQDGSYGQAAELAKSKKTLADAELASGHPVGYGLRATGKGAAIGAIRGNIFSEAVARGMNPAATLNYQRQVGKLAS